MEEEWKEKIDSLFVKGTDPADLPSIKKAINEESPGKIQKAVKVNEIINDDPIEYGLQSINPLKYRWRQAHA